MLPYVLAVTGASAQPLAERALLRLLQQERAVHLVLSRGAHEVFRAEQGLSIPVEPEQQERFWRERLQVNSGSLQCHRWNDQAASIASGSYRTKAMVIVPCSMGTVGRINAGVAMDLIERCADVHLKERRPLVIAPREMPFNLIHLRNLTALAEAGATIAAPIPAWYTQPTSLDEMVDFLVVRLFDGLEENLAPLRRWTGPIA
ncbi:MAG: amino acid decarboxylase [Synechococcus sp. ARS1019]|nr:amino acid decarboxylase [Synechococcus sp. ARS1019]|tara:strand:- start:1774 stop:2382 length:609 start_codon:yes stop_codon:yes gene_type:complete